jgi:hypothetical protein
VLDLSGHENHGTTSGGVTRVVDVQRGHVLSFNGLNGMVTVPDNASLDLRNGVTLEAWVKPTALAGWRSVILKEDTDDLAYALYANQDVARPAGFIHVAPMAQSVQSKSPLLAAAWTHLAMTYDGAAMRLYVNGSLVTTKNQAGPVTMSNGDLRLGGNALWGEWFSGAIDDVRIYDVAVSAAQIRADMGMED